MKGLLGAVGFGSAGFPSLIAIGLLVDYVFKKQVSFAFIFCECQNGLKRLGNHVHFYNECYSKRNAAQGHLKPYYDSMYVRLSPKANEAPLHQSSGRPSSAQRRQAREHGDRYYADHEAPERRNFEAPFLPWL